MLMCRLLLCSEFRGQDLRSRGSSILWWSCSFAAPGRCWKSGVRAVGLTGEVAVESVGSDAIVWRSPPRRRHPRQPAGRV